MFLSSYPYVHRSFLQHVQSTYVPIKVIHIFISRISFLFFLSVRLVYFLALISFLEVTKIWNNRQGIAA